MCDEHLFKMRDAVCDEDTFVAFVTALAVDRADEVKKEKEKPLGSYGAGTNGWQHGTIEDFLDAAAAFAADWKKNLEGLPKSDNPWRRCARILLGGKHYE